MPPLNSHALSIIGCCVTFPYGVFITREVMAVVATLVSRHLVSVIPILVVPVEAVNDQRVAVPSLKPRNLLTAEIALNEAVGTPRVEDIDKLRCSIRILFITFLTKRHSSMEITLALLEQL